MTLVEGNLDGLVGPTHNYAGLSFGNEASQSHAGKVSNPQAATLQGLQKMHILMQRGIPQMVMPPHPRPYGKFLAGLGFRGTLRRQVEQAARQKPDVLATCYSASGMWAANAATMAPGTDTPDGRAHFTPANLISTAHRAMEAEFTSHVLKRLFPDEKHFAHHPPLSASPVEADEGAANHMRLALPDGKGLHVFVYGRDQASPMQHTRKYPARQTMQASQAVARLHGLDAPHAPFIRQHPQAIDAGVFHNDVIATSNDHLLLYHENAYAGGDAPVEALQRAANGQLCIVRISVQQMDLQAVVQTYLFNSQIVTLPGGGMLMIAPVEAENHKQARGVIDALCADDKNPVREVQFIDLRESMRNGGGPACLRLRIPLTAAQWKRVHQGALLTEALYGQLTALVKKHYRDRLHPDDLADPQLAEEAQAALEALAVTLHLQGIYDG